MCQIHASTVDFTLSAGTYKEWLLKEIVQRACLHVSVYTVYIFMGLSYVVLRMALLCHVHACTTKTDFSTVFFLSK